MAVGPVEGLIPVQDGLDRVLPGRDQPEPLHGEAEHRVTDDGLRTGSQTFDIDPEHLLARGAHVHLEPGLTFVALRHDQDDPTVLGFVSQGVGKGDGELEVRGRSPELGPVLAP